MSLPVITDVVRVTFNWNNNNVGRANNVMHFLDTGSLTASDALTLMDSSLGSGCWEWVSSASAIETIEFLPLNGTAATTVLPSPGGSSWQGHSGSSDTSPQVAGLVKFGTAERGPAHRGRIFIPHVAETKVLNGAMDSVATVQSNWESFVAAMATGEFPLVIASYAHASQAAVTNLTAEDMASTIRRRLHR